MQICLPRVKKQPRKESSLLREAEELLLPQGRALLLVCPGTRVEVGHQGKVISDFHFKHIFKK